WAAPPPAAASEPTPQPPAASEPASPPPASADEERRRLEEQIARELGQQQAVRPATPPGAPPDATAQSGQGAGQGTAGSSAAPWARVLLLPDISAIASFSLAHDTYDVEALSPREGPHGPAQKPTFHFEELELGLQSVIDPYARADVFVSFTPEEVSVEEAFLTTLGLPAGLQVKAGRFFSPFGRLNARHPHTWELVDAPLARGRLLATEVLAGPGVDLSWLTPLPWFAELHLVGQSTAPYGGPERLTGVAALQQYFELGEAATLGVGVSAARRDEGPGQFRDLGGVDAYLHLRPPGSRAWLNLQGELVARRFRGGPAPDGGDGQGGYVQAVWREGPYLGLGARYDQAPAGGASAPGTERRWSALGAWYLTEFQRLRLQVAYDRRPGGQDGWESILHLEFAIGAHGAHPF
ncbi:MAG TPA: hypothetical protein VFP50_18750, partial [Anaeromyxobacteraceae bacterium]|nr:hypothetical protein [Anaeromyxobacteraceae bacterium]